MNNTSTNNNPHSTSQYKDYGMCVRFPPKIHSEGLWEDSDPLKYAVPSLELQMVVIFTLTRLLYFPLKRLGVPKLFCEILAGIILGPTAPKELRKWTTLLFPIETQGVIGTLTLFGYTLFMFLVGVKTDLGMVTSSGRKAFAVGMLSLMAPFIFGIATLQVLISKFLREEDQKSIASLFIALSLQCLSPFPVIVLLLRDLKILNSELGRLALSSAVTSEIMSLSLTFLMKTFKTYLEVRSAAIAFQKLGLTICFVLMVIIIIRPVMLWVIRQTPEGRPVKDSYLYAIILLIFLGGAFTHWIGEFVALGPFMIGFAIPDGPPLGSALADKLEVFVSGLFMPLFMTLIALRANLQAINFSSPFMMSGIIMIVVTFSVKVAACVLPCWICRVPFKDALALGFMMSAKGVIQMSFYSFFRDDRSFNEEIYALLVVSTAVATILVPVCINQLYDPSRKYAGYRKRNLMHCRGEGETRILICVHRLDNIPAFISLLDISCPTKESPLMVYVLHLIELHGRSSPLFISHQMHQNSENSYSEEVIFAFARYERKNLDAVNTLAFTAISPRKLMHEDICTLSLDKKVDLIVLPFHRKWAKDGSIEDEDLSLKSVNCKILDMAPCSVGILVDRGARRHQGRGSSASEVWLQRVAVIFFGGSDDREALVYGQRMAHCSGISLTVVRFIATVEEGFGNKDKALDSDVLEDVIRGGGGGDDDGEYVYYVEEVVKDGPETALIVREMANEFDLIIVGGHRNLEIPQTSGLKEWSECPELGVIGDMLASPDIKSRASVLVIQQQRLMR